MTTPSPTKADKAPRELFKNIAYDELRARFDNRLYPPGTFLSERQLADELGMSKTPVKAARKTRIRRFYHSIAAIWNCGPRIESG